jgi:hypothetical protein
MANRAENRCVIARVKGPVSRISNNERTRLREEAPCQHERKVRAGGGLRREIHTRGTAVRAQIIELGQLSIRAGESKLLRWLSSFKAPLHSSIGKFPPTSGRSISARSAGDTEPTV